LVLFVAVMNKHIVTTSSDSSRTTRIEILLCKPPGRLFPHLSAHRFVSNPTKSFFTHPSPGIPGYWTSLVLQIKYSLSTHSTRWNYLEASAKCEVETRPWKLVRHSSRRPSSKEHVLARVSTISKFAQTGQRHIWQRELMWAL
jgi:hypothetical protein